MSYEKRLVILKQLKRGFTADGGALTGAVYAERLGSELTITPRIAGIAPVGEGRYALVVRAGEENFCFEWKGNAPLRVPEAPSISEGFSALLCYVRDGAEPIAFGSCGRATLDPAALLSALGKKNPPNPLPPYEQPLPFGPQVPLAPVPPLPEFDEPPFHDRAGCGGSGYDDEAIAEADYYARGQDNGDARAEIRERAQTEKEEGKGGADEDDADGGVHPFGFARRSLTYYQEVRERLEEAMKRFPAAEELQRALPGSRWVRAEGAYLGIVYEEGLPRYLCVAAEGEEPEEMKGRSVFVPKAPYTDEGYFVVFQDADTGEYVAAREG